jgi:hypothetical protein
MKVDPSKLTIPRLKAYRTSLLRKVARYEICDCGDMGCDHQMERNKNRPVYLDAKSELERVNQSLGEKQKKVREVEATKNWAQVSTIDEEKRHFNPPWREVKKTLPNEKRKIAKKLREYPQLKGNW